jgi:predicted Zn-dependent protease
MRIKTILIAAVWLFVFQVSCPMPGLAISIPDEKKLADEFMQMIHNKKMILHDPVVTHYISQIGTHLLTFLPPQPFKYSFYAVDEDIFNAFAAPGANIFIYRGLITSLESEHELAGIIGHEIAHAASRHVSESIDRSKYISIGSLAGVLAGAIIGGKADPEAAQTIISGSIALGHTTMLAFTRENETEADEKGIMFLKRSCFAPSGLLGGLMKIRDADFRGVEGIPEYLKTHPGTGNRIAHAETILAGYVPPEAKPSCRLDLDFGMVKYRLIGLYAKPEPAIAKLETLLAKNGQKDAALLYGLGLLYARKQRIDDAISYLKRALSLRMLDPMIQMDLGRVYLLNGESEKALNVLTGLETDPVLGVGARYYQAEAFLAQHSLLKAENGFRSVILKAPDAFPKAYYNLARVKSISGETGLSHYYLGIYYSVDGNRKNAVHHLKKAIEKLSDHEKKEDAKIRLEALEKEPR